MIPLFWIVQLKFLDQLLGVLVWIEPEVWIIGFLQVVEHNQKALFLTEYMIDCGHERQMDGIVRFEVKVNQVFGWFRDRIVMPAPCAAMCFKIRLLSAS